jgi:hypothetical protein
MQLERGTQLGDYEILEPVGSGGMGEVYRARDIRLDRDVAIKILPQEVAEDPSRRARFEREAKSVAALNHENIVTIHTIGMEEGIHYLAMELVEGEPLDQRIPEAGLTTDDLLDLAIPIAAALAAAHQKGIIHRDLKPANVMVTDDGKVKVLDFGLAKLARVDDEPVEPVGEDSETATMTLQTRAGTVVGTMPYMSPEQLSGKAVGPASDVFSLGVMLYEMAIGSRPFKGNTGPTLISSILTDMPQPVATLRPTLPSALGELIERCLVKDPDDRLMGAEELRRDLELLRTGLTSADMVVEPSAARGRRWLRFTAIAVVVALAVGAALWFGLHAKETRWARTVALPEVQRLFDAGERYQAWRLLREAATIIPADPLLERVESGNTLPVSVETIPAGGEVFVNSYKDHGEPWLHLGTAPLEVSLPVAVLRFRVEKSGYETFVGSGADLTSPRFELVPEGSAPPGMVRIPAGSATFGEPGAVDLAAFWLDKNEISNAEFKEFVDAGGYRDPEHWRQTISADGREVAWDEAIRLFVDTTGRPGPATWELGSYPDGTADHPVGGVSWYEAAAYARWANKSLPTVFHWHRAAEQGLFSDVLTVSNFDGEGPAQVGSYGGVGPYGTYDMAGNVREWCLNRLGTARYTLGGAWSDPSYRYRDSDADDPLDRSAKNGFRCMKTDGEIEAETTVAIDLPVHDFSQEQPVGDDIFSVLKGQFAYDHTELDAEIEGVDDSSEHWRRERISFKAAYGVGRVPAYLYLPKNVEPPYQTVVFFPSSAALEVDNSRNPGLFIVNFFIRSGRALMYPIYMGTYERRVEIEGPNATRDLIIQQSKDMRRAIDYLETRDDIDAAKLAFCGLSWGGSWGPIFTAVEDRFKASVLIAGGMGRYPPDRPAESIPLNFMPRSTVPVLMLNGRDDFTAPIETEIKAMFAFQGAPEQHKKLVLLAGGHVPDKPKEFVREALDWLDRYLGPVE